jgi:hypothetical protein
MADGSMGISDQDLVREQRTPQGRRYQNWMAELRHQMATDPKFAEHRRAEGREIRSVAPGQVHSNVFMSNLSVQYKNDEYIGEQLMPVVPVMHRSDAFPTYNKRDRTNVPDDAMASRSDANELNETRGSDNYSVVDYALKNHVPHTTVENEDNVFDEMVDIVESVNEGLALKREIRIATVLTTTANYSASNTTTLSGANQWNDASGGNPIKNLQDALAACWSGFGPGEFVGFCSLDVWNVLARHQSTLDLFKGTMPGLTKMDRLAQELGLARILVGAARYDTANIGQSTASYSRIWGKHFGIVRVAKRPTIRNASFGYTVRMKNDPTTRQWFDASKGAKGAYFAQVAVSEQHKICAADSGYLIYNAIS